MANRLIGMNNLKTLIIGIMVSALLGGIVPSNNATLIISQDNPAVWSINGQFGKKGITQLPEQWSWNVSGNTTHLYEYSPNKIIGVSLLYTPYPIIQPFDSVSVYSVNPMGQIEVLPFLLGFIKRRYYPSSEYDPIIGIQSNGRIIYFSENNQLRALNSNLTPELTFGSVLSSSLPFFQLTNAYSVMPDNKIILLAYEGDFYELDANGTNITKTGTIPSKGVDTYFNKFSGVIYFERNVIRDDTFLSCQANLYNIRGKLIKQKQFQQNQPCPYGNWIAHPKGGFITPFGYYSEYMFSTYSNQSKSQRLRYMNEQLEYETKFENCTPETCPCISNFTLFALQTDGKYVFADFTDYGLPSAKLKITRCLPDTSYDPTFGQNGVLTLPFPKQTFQLKDLLVQQDGQIVLAFAQDINIDINLADKDLRGFFLMKIGSINIRHQQFLPFVSR